jgi:hypothetical protein
MRPLSIADPRDAHASASQKLKLSRVTPDRDGDGRT